MTCSKSPSIRYLAELGFEPRSTFLQSSKFFPAAEDGCVSQLCCITNKSKISVVCTTHAFLALVNVSGCSWSSARLCSVCLLKLSLWDMPILWQKGSARKQEGTLAKSLKTLSWMWYASLLLTSYWPKHVTWPSQWGQWCAILLWGKGKEWEIEDNNMIYFVCPFGHKYVLLSHLHLIYHHPWARKIVLKVTSLHDRRPRVHLVMVSALFAKTSLPLKPLLWGLVPSGRNK